jgi:hypothetical protein
MDGVPLPDGFGPAPARSEGSGWSVARGEKAIAAERPANALRAAQTGEQTRLLLLARQRIGETGEAVANGLQRRSVHSTGPDGTQ